MHPLWSCSGPIHDANGGIFDQTASMSENVSSHVTITPLENGPLEVVGHVHIEAPDGTTLRDSDKCYLCRCGHSGNKPFCDGSHKREGWSE